MPPNSATPATKLGYRRRWHRCQEMRSRFRSNLALIGNFIALLIKAAVFSRVPKRYYSRLPKYVRFMEHLLSTLRSERRRFKRIERLDRATAVAVRPQVAAESRVAKLRDPPASASGSISSPLRTNGRLGGKLYLGKTAAVTLPNLSLSEASWNIATKARYAWRKRWRMFLLAAWHSGLGELLLFGGRSRGL